MPFERIARTVSVLWIAAAVPLLAQSPPDAPTPALAPLKTTVTVTGTRTATEVDRSPVSTSLITRHDMETRNVVQIDQAVQLTEGVISSRAKGPEDSDFGVGLRGFSGRGGQYRTLILLDGQPINDAYIGSVQWSTLPVSEFERVEVARGPFSSLYGGNAMGGVINLITRPVDHREMDLFAQYGERDTTNYSVHLADRFFHKLGLSFGYQRYQSGGYQNQPVLKTAATSGTGAIPVTGVTPWLTTSGTLNYQTGERGREWFNQQAYRGRAEYTFSPKLFASAQYLRQTRQGGYDAYSTSLRDSQGRPVDSGLVSFADPAGVTRLLSMAPSNYIGIPTGSAVNLFQGQVLATLTPSWNLRVMGGVNDTPNQWYVSPGAAATLSTGDGTYTRQDSRGYYGNIQAGWTRSGRHQFIFGTETRQDSANIFVLPIPNYAIRGNEGAASSQSHGASVNQAAYVQDQIGVTERLNVVIGGRYDYWRTSDGNNQRNLSVPITAYPDNSTSAFTGKIAAAYQLPLGFQLRGSVGNAFRNPSVYELYRDLSIGSTLYLANPNAKSERLLSYEAGLVKRLGDRVTVDAAYYENRVKDLLYRTTDLAADPTGRTIRLSNVGLARTRGLELSAREKPLSWLQFHQSYTFTQSVITSNPSLPATVGKRVPYVPAHMTSFEALIARGRWTGSASGRYSSRVYSTDTNSDIVRGVPGGSDPFFVADLTAGYNLTRHLTLTTTVFNLLDRQYFQYYRTPGRQVLAGIRIRL